MWIAFGMILAILEIFVPNFVIIWFGLSAVVVGLVMLLHPLSLTTQMLLWALGSALWVAVWFLGVKPRMADRTTAGQAREAILGAVGTVIDPPREAHRGKIRFPAPLLGSDEWLCIAEGERPLAVGDRAVVTELAGNTVIVKRKA
jgi:membrane protein implicated in regulation of membrane protease activity